MGEFFEDLINYASSDYYPFHMPGHKRNMKGYYLEDAYQIDLTEIDGFDNLHHPEGIIFELEKKIAKLYHSEESHILVNGSTVGILSAISGCVSKSGKILMARNSHKSAYNALLLNECKSIFVYPEYVTDFGISGGIAPKQIRVLLEKHTDIQAVFLTSPTYEGIISPIKEIVEIAHEKGIPVIVDEAHGAHFGFFKPLAEEYQMETALNYGADIVIHSIHKTLPAFTQSALIHLQGKLINRQKVKKYLSIYQSSSPSYLLMAGIDQCISIMEQSEELFRVYKRELEIFYQKVKDFKNLKILCSDCIGTFEISGFDIGKIIISTRNTNWNGKQLYDCLNHKYHLQLEMSSGDYCLGIITIMDKPEGLKRLEKALREIDYQLQITSSNQYNWKIPEAESIFTIAEVEDREKEEIEFNNCLFKTAGDYVYAYPPGIPIIAPGESINKEIFQMVGAMRKMEIQLTGMEEGKLKVLKEDSFL